MMNTIDSRDPIERRTVKKSLTLFAGLALPFLLEVSTPTLAALDGKTYAGTMCNAGTNFTASTTTGVLLNTSSSAKTWTCPIVRDTMAAKQDGIKKARVWVIDDSGVDRVLCTLKSRASTGSNTDEQTRSSTIAQESATTIVLSDFTNIASSSKGYYVLRCSIPGKKANGDRSGIRSYYVEEG